MGNKKENPIIEIFIGFALSIIVILWVRGPLTNVVSLDHVQANAIYQGKIVIRPLNFSFSLIESGQEIKFGSGSGIRKIINNPPEIGDKVCIDYTRESYENNDFSFTLNNINYMERSNG